MSRRMVIPVKSNRTNMKATKIFLKSEILFGILLTGALALCFTACDSLKEDPDVLTPDTALKGSEVYVSGNRASVIDLNELIRTNLPVTLTVTQPTSKGKLSSLGLGLLRYAPDNRNTNTRDAFEFTVYSESHEILARDTVVIVVEPDSTKLPCNLYPTDDYVYNFHGDHPVTIDVLANDNFCGTDSLDYQVSVFWQGTNTGPRHGDANVVNNKIVYTAGASYTKGDTLLYKIQSRANLTRIAFGYVYISASTITVPCTFTLLDDTIAFNPDTLKTDTVWLRVFDNDNLCDSASHAYTMKIGKGPLYGQAHIGWDGITYAPDNPPSGAAYIDSLRYQLCLEGVCRQASVVVKITP
jgi:hypothetical protein